MAEPIDMTVYRRFTTQADKGGDLQTPGGGGTSDGMDGRVSRLEAHMEHVREDTAEIKQVLRDVSAKLDGMATKSDLWAWKWQWTALAFATMAIIIGSIIGGLSWIKPDGPTSTAPQSIVITVPASPSK